jgi:hypothetical protein
LPLWIRDAEEAREGIHRSSANVRPDRARFVIIVQRHMPFPKSEGFRARANRNSRKCGERICDRGKRPLFTCVCSPPMGLTDPSRNAFPLPRFPGTGHRESYSRLDDTVVEGWSRFQKYYYLTVEYSRSTKRRRRNVRGGNIPISAPFFVFFPAHFPPSACSGAKSFPLRRFFVSHALSVRIGFLYARRVDVYSRAR